MAYRLACEAADGIAAVGPDSLTQVHYASVDESLTFWLQANGCNMAADSSREGNVRHDRYALGCVGGTAVELYAIEGFGHAWPGGQPGWAAADSPEAAISAREVIWAFFAVRP